MTDPRPALAPRLEARSVTKRFQSFVANDKIGFQVMPGEIHALLGENGAGKSTLVKMVYGLLQPDAGGFLWNGQPVSIQGPNAARRLGIGMVFQHFSLFEALSVAENIALGLDKGADSRKLATLIDAVSRRYGLALDPRRPVHSLSVGERQRVEIVRCLLKEPSLLIMDEPTSVLTPQECERLFETLRRLAHEGCSVLYISHKLEEIKALCHKATILRDGRVVGECDPARTSARAMAEMMIGHELALIERRPAIQAGPPRLSVTGLDLERADPMGVDLADIAFDVHAGEILGIAGIAGNGQTELALALSGESGPADPASIRVNGTAIGELGPERRRRLGLLTVPEERNGHAAVSDMPLFANALLSARHRMGLVRHGLVRKRATNGFARRIIERFGVKASGPASPAGTLSGGNLQKFVVGREILQEPEVLVVSQPTWGVDAGAASAIHQALFDLARAGAAIVVLSQDLDELLAISDRIMVINGGRLSKPMPAAEVSAEEIGLLMGGTRDETGRGTDDA